MQQFAKLWRRKASTGSIPVLSVLFLNNMSDMYTGYTLLEKFDILGQGILYAISLFFHWRDLLESQYDEVHTKCFFYSLNGDHFYNAVAMEDKDFYLWKLSNWARNYPFSHRIEKHL